MNASWTAAATRACRVRAVAMCAVTGSGSESTYAAADCIGAARLDQISLATPIRALISSRPHALSGTRAKPMRQPPKAMDLLSPLVTAGRSGKQVSALGAETSGHASASVAGVPHTSPTTYARALQRVQ